MSSQPPTDVSGRRLSSNHISSFFDAGSAAMRGSREGVRGSVEQGRAHGPRKPSAMSGANGRRQSFAISFAGSSMVDKMMYSWASRSRIGNGMAELSTEKSIAFGILRGGQRRGPRTPGAAESGGDAPAGGRGGGGVAEKRHAGESSTAMKSMSDAWHEEQRVAAEVRLQAMWRVQMKGVAGLEAEIAKLRAGETAKQILREWEVEQEAMRRRRGMAKALQHQPAAITMTAGPPAGSGSSSSSGGGGGGETHEGEAAASAGGQAPSVPENRAAAQSERGRTSLMPLSGLLGGAPHPPPPIASERLERPGALSA